MRILVIGHGSAGQAHAKNIEQFGGDVEIMDPQFPSCSTMRNWNEFDGFVIASPTLWHIDHLLACYEYHKLILVEKPIALEPLDSGFLEHLAELNPRIYVAYQMRYLQPLMQVKEDLLSGVFGKILEVVVKYGYDIRKWHGPENPYLARDGILLEASHELDYLLWLFGDLQFAVGALGFFTNFGEKESQVHLIYHSRNPVILTQSGFGMISVRLNYVQPEYERTLEVIGEKGTRKIHFPMEEIAEARVEMMRDWLGVVDGREPGRLATIQDSMTMLMVIDQAKKYAKVFS